jgi:hypothetical protein
MQDVANLNGLSNQDKIFIYICDQCINEGIFASKNVNITFRSLQNAINHITEQGATVLLLISSHSPQSIREFAINCLDVDKQSRPVTIITDENHVGYSYSVALRDSELMIGTEFCQVLLTLLSELEDSTETIRQFHKNLPSKFFASFGSNADDPLKDYFGDHINHFSTAFAPAKN